jgi:transposase-like protein
MSPRRDVVELSMGSDGGATGRRTDAERLAIVTEAFEGGSSVHEVAERRGVSTASIYLWRRQLRDATTNTARETPVRKPSAHPLSPRSSSPRSSSAITLVPVRIAPIAREEAVAAPAPMRVEQVEIALANGRILKVCVSIDPLQLAHLVAALEGHAP